MLAEDYLECAEKLLKLGTKNQTEREVVFVLTDCCMQVILISDWLIQSNNNL